MHSDILEFFVMYQSVPIFMFGKPSLVDEVLKAGRISVQAILGKEATGEQLKMEVLSESYIIYEEFGDFLIALRARNTISPQGAKKIIRNVKEILTKNEKIIKKKLGALKSLRHIERLIDLTLGESVLSTPQGLMKLDSISDQAMKNIDMLEAIILITNESWPIYVLYRDVANPPKLDKNVWRNAVENLYNSLQNDCNIEIRIEKNSLFILKRINLSQKEDWWVLIAHGRLKHPPESVPAITQLQAFFENVETLIFSPAEKIVKEMVEDARKYWGMKGILSDPIKLVSLEKEKAPIIQFSKSKVNKQKTSKKQGIISLETKETIGNPLRYEVITKYEKKIITLRELPEKFLFSVENNAPVVIDDIKFTTANLILDEPGTRYLMSMNEWIATMLSSTTPLEFYMGIEAIPNPKIHLPRLRSLTENGIFVHLFTSDPEFREKAVREGIHTTLLSRETGIDSFLFNLVVPINEENKQGIALILYSVPDGPMRGIISIDKDILSLTRGRLEEIESEETS